MNTRLILKYFFLSGILYLVSFTAFPQSSALKNAEAAAAAARARVEMNEQKVAAADSIINAGEILIDESKREMKAIDADSRKLEKEHEAGIRPLQKLVKSKDRTEANKARLDLRAFETEYKAANRALETRLREAVKKQTTGISSIERGKTARRNAMDALKLSQNALKAAEAKFNAAAGNPDTKPVKKKNKK